MTLTTFFDITWVMSHWYIETSCNATKVKVDILTSCNATKVKVDIFQFNINQQDATIYENHNTNTHGMVLRRNVSSLFAPSYIDSCNGMYCLANYVADWTELSRSITVQSLLIPLTCMYVTICIWTLDSSKHTSSTP